MAPVATMIEKKICKEINVAFKREKTGKSVTINGELTLAGLFADRMLLIKLIGQGIPSSLFLEIEGYTPFTDADWATFLNVSVKSLKRYKQSGHVFKPIQSEKIIEVAEVTTIGLDTFGDMDKFRLWLATPNFALGSLTPMELLKDSYGKELVISELVRINHGILV